MQNPNQSRRELAQYVAEQYSGHDSVAAIGLCGSVAREAADEESDIDVYVFWTRLDYAWLEPPPLRQFGGERFSFSGKVPNGDCVEQYYLRGIKIDLAHQQLVSRDEIFTQVFEHNKISPLFFKYMSAIADLKPFYGDEEILRMVGRTSDYPDELRAKAIAEFLQFRPISLMELCLLRHDLLGFYSYLVESAANAAAVVAALNGKFFHPAAEQKGALRIFSSSPVCPPNLSRVLRELFEQPSREGLKRLHTELLCLVDLVKELVPAENVSRVVSSLAFMLRKPPGAHS